MIKQQCSIVIITLNEERNIANLLDDLCRQSHKDFEVIVVDSASTDTTVETAQKFADRLDLKTIGMVAVPVWDATPVRKTPVTNVCCF